MKVRSVQSRVSVWEHLKSRKDLNLSDSESLSSLLFPPLVSQAYFVVEFNSYTEVNIDGELQFSNVAIPVLGR